MAVLAAAGPAAPEAIRRVRWEHPEWPLWLVAGTAWAVAAFQPPMPGALDAWVVAVTAMLLPLVAGDARWLAHRSLASRRRRTVVLHGVSFLAVWVAIGVVSVTIAALIRAMDPGAPRLAAAGLLVTAAAWHGTGPRRRAVQRCGVRRLPATVGVRADLDTLAAGLASGRRCVVTCGVPMIAMAFVHGLALMAALAAITISERRPGPNAHRRIGRPQEALALAGVAVVVAFAG